MKHTSLKEWRITEAKVTVRGIVATPITKAGVRVPRWTTIEV